MKRVTNTLKRQTIGVAGRAIRPRASVGMTDVEWERAQKSRTVQVWLEQGILTVEDGPDNPTETRKEPSGAPVQESRDELLERARALGLRPRHNASVDTLRTMVEQASREADQQTDQE